MRMRFEEKRYSMLFLIISLDSTSLTRVLESGFCCLVILQILRFSAGLFVSFCVRSARSGQGHLQTEASTSSTVRGGIHLTV